MSVLLFSSSAAAIPSTFLFPFLPEMVLVSFRCFRFNFQITVGNVSTKAFTFEHKNAFQKRAYHLLHYPSRGGRRMSAQGGVCQWGGCLGGGITPHVNRITDRCKKNTFLQLRLRAVKIKQLGINLHLPSCTIAI